MSIKFGSKIGIESKECMWGMIPRALHFFLHIAFGSDANAQNSLGMETEVFQCTGGLL